LPVSSSATSSLVTSATRRSFSDFEAVNSALLAASSQLSLLVRQERWWGCGHGPSGACHGTDDLRGDRRLLQPVPPGQKSPTAARSRDTNAGSQATIRVLKTPRARAGR
jgi:hypothetical protein